MIGIAEHPSREKRRRARRAPNPSQPPPRQWSDLDEISRTYNKGGNAGGFKLGFRDKINCSNDEIGSVQIYPAEWYDPTKCESLLMRISTRMKVMRKIRSCGASESESKSMICVKEGK